MLDVACKYIVIGAVIYLAVLVLKTAYLKCIIAPQIDLTIRQELDKRIHDVTTEICSDIEYWYERESGQFIAQGRTQEEIASVLKAVWPGHVFLVNERHLWSAPSYTPIPVDQLYNRK